MRVIFHINKYLFIPIIFFFSFLHPCKSQLLNKNATILFIGDSNTQMGFITAQVESNLIQNYGDFGSGYTSLHKRSLWNSAGSIIIDSSWTKYDAYECGPRLNPPYLSPQLQWITSNTKGAKTTITFTGNSIDIYWVRSTIGGDYSITLDGDLVKIVSTSGIQSAQKTSITGLKSSQHTAVFSVVIGSVTLMGADIIKDVSGENYRAIVHNWGKNCCSTVEFCGIDSLVFQNSLKCISPNVTVILLGTNDHNIQNLSALQFKINLIKLINRIKTAVPSTQILLVSTFYTNTDQAQMLLPEYLKISYPEAAIETGVEYWDMCTWFGPFKNSRMIDNYHTNKIGATYIGNEMWNQIKSRFGYNSTNISSPVIHK